MVPPIFVMTLIKQFFNTQATDIGALDRGLQFGDGHFTTLRILNAAPEHLEAHLARLAHANKTLRIYHSTFTTLRNRLTELAKDVEQGVCKVIVTRGNSAQGYGYDHRIEANEYIQISTLPEPQNPLDVGLANVTLAEQTVLAGLKTLNRLEQVLLSAEKSEKGLDDLVVCTNDGRVIEAVQGNLFWKKRGRWQTPSLTSAGIDGVMRQHIINSNALGNLDIKEGRVADLEQAEQIFVCNSVRGAVPVRSFNGKVFEDLPLPEKVKRLAL